jgi:hypothetical protein
VCGLEALKMRRPTPELGCCDAEKEREEEEENGERTGKEYK